MAIPSRETWIEPLLPYSLALTAERLGRFDDGIDHFDGERFRRLVFARGAPLLVSVWQQGSAARARLRLRVEGRAAEHEDAIALGTQLAERMLGTRQELKPFYRALRSDPVLARPIRDLRGLRVAGAASLFEALLTAILSQQVNLAFAYSIRGDMARRFGRRARIGGRRFVAFPTPRRLAKLSFDELRALRLSGAKARAIQALAEAFRSGALRESRLAQDSDEQVIEQLVTLPGIGRWTAEIALLRGLGRPDVFPAADLAVVKVLAQQLLRRAHPAREAEMRAYSERWRPWRSLALVYAYAEVARRASRP